MRLVQHDVDVRDTVRRLDHKFLRWLPSELLQSRHISHFQCLQECSVSSAQFRARWPIEIRMVIHEKCLGWIHGDAMPPGAFSQSGQLLTLEIHAIQMPIVRT